MLWRRIHRPIADRLTSWSRRGLPTWLIPNHSVVCSSGGTKLRSTAECASHCSSNRTAGRGNVVLSAAVRRLM
jgi:hypothetical protein